MSRSEKSIWGIILNLDNFMLLIYLDKITNRAGYTLNLVFRDLIGVDFTITTSRDEFLQYCGPKFSYCQQKLCDEVFLASSPLLFQTAIEFLEIDYMEQDGLPYFFRVYSKDSVFTYDVLASSFYLVSRYEEYLPFIQDEHSRFKAEDSLAYKKGFLQKPVVNIWAEKLKHKLVERYPELTFRDRYFSFVNTIDVDSAFSYIGKGFMRGTGGFFRDLFRGDAHLCWKRLKVLMGKDSDPFDNFDYIISLIKALRVRTVFFVLFGLYGKFDKNISPYNRRFQMLVKSLCDYAKVGIHPSYESFLDSEALKEQVKMLSSILHKPIHRSRFHYLRFRLPETYRHLIDNNIEMDFSMGYSSNVGFRAGICSSFNFYDLALDVETKLKVYPFAYMDVALKNGLNLSCQSAWETIQKLTDEVVMVNGEMISIWHNESLSDEFEWKGWRSVYEKALDYASMIDKVPYSR